MYRWQDSGKVAVSRVGCGSIQKSIQNGDDNVRLCRSLLVNETDP